MDGAHLGIEGRPAPVLRRVAAADVRPLVALAREQYPGYSLDQAEAWAKALLGLPNAAAFHCGEACAVVAWQAEFFRPQARVADVLVMYGKAADRAGWASFRLLRACCAWAKDQGCYGLRFGSSIDLLGGPAGGPDLYAAFAARLNARVFGVSYIKEL